MSKLTKNYSRLFAIDEIAQSGRLQIVFWIVWGLSLLDLNQISFSYFRDWRPPACWEHFPNCLNVFDGSSVLPDSYLYTGWMTLVLALLFVGAFSAIRKRWELAHFTLLIVIFWKFIWNMWIFDYGTSNFEYFHLIPAFGFLLTHHKLHQLRFLWVLTYFFTPYVKLDDGWIVGTYFTSLQSGLALAPEVLVPWITNAVILFELVCAVGLLSKNKKWAQFSLYGWTAFHLYSTLLVGFFYPVRCLSMLWALFALREDSEFAQMPPYAQRRSVAALVIALYICVANFIPSIISPNPNETFEGMNYGLHMFNSNHQCLNRFTKTNQQTGAVEKSEFSSTNAMNRCYPQWTLQRLKVNCSIEPVKIEWQLIHSKNGGPFHTIVDTQDACALEFKSFTHNEWIRTASTGAPSVGYPEKNGIQPKALGPSPVIHNTPQIQLSAVQEFLLSKLLFFKMVYGLLWVCLFFYLMKIYFLGNSRPWKR